MNRMTVYDPFADGFPHLLRSLGAPLHAEVRKPSLRIDVAEAADAYTVHADIPGVSKNDIKVEVDGNRVSISTQVDAGNAANKAANQSETGQLRSLRTERLQGALSRSFTLESEIDDEAASASYADGVLKLSLPKKVVAGARQLKIS